MNITAFGNTGSLIKNAFRFGLFLFLLAAAPDLSAAEGNSGPGSFPDHYKELTPGIYRGGQPSEEALQGLRSRGINTVVSFRHETKQVLGEKELVESLGMKFVSLPWRIQWHPKTNILEELFKVLDNSANHPVFIHCKYGRDRTGVMSVFVKMRYEGLSFDDAKKEVFDSVSANWRYRLFVHFRLKHFAKQMPDLREGFKAHPPN